MDQISVILGKKKHTFSDFERSRTEAGIKEQPDQLLRRRQTFSSCRRLYRASIQIRSSSALESKNELRHEFRAPTTRADFRRRHWKARLGTSSRSGAASSRSMDFFEEERRGRKEDSGN